MKYVCLIYDAEQELARMSPAEHAAFMGEYGTFTEQVIASGHMRGGEELQPVASATSVRLRNGRVVTTDGPFAETREQLGGFYLLEAQDLNEAIAIASRIPSARTGTVEVRPVAIHAPSAG
jgi:hypothetical protein